MDGDARARRGLFVRGLVTDETAAGEAALRMKTMSELSIGFIARDWSARVGRGRDLREIELREISLVTSPMLPGARFVAAAAVHVDCKVLPGKVRTA
jgi:uncharacterized protein